MARWVRRTARETGQLLLPFASAPTRAPSPPAPCPGRAQTSVEAAAAVDPARSQTLRDRMLAIIRGREDGATRDELAALLGIPIQTVCPRVDELIHMGDVVQTADRRPTRSGRSAFILRARAGR